MQEFRELPRPQRFNIVSKRMRQLALQGHEVPERGQWIRRYKTCDSVTHQQVTGLVQRIPLVGARVSAPLAANRDRNRRATTRITRSSQRTLGGYSKNGESTKTANTDGVFVVSAGGGPAKKYPLKILRKFLLVKMALLVRSGPLLTVK